MSMNTDYVRGLKITSGSATWIVYPISTASVTESVNIMPPTSRIETRSPGQNIHLSAKTIGYLFK